MNRAANAETVGLLIRGNEYFVDLMCCAEERFSIKTEDVNMAENSGCSGNCSSCGSDCGGKAHDMHEPINKSSSVKHVIGVVSGKGGVGKSTVTASLAVLMNRRGYEVGILDADITGPSIPKMFGMNRRATADDRGILPEISANGIKVMSSNLLLDSEESPVVWRGPVIAGAVKQFWTDVVWGDLDYMFIDMPPGTGDVPLTVYQTIKLDGIVIVTSPQDLVSMIVKKAYNMAQMLDIPPIGVIENMSYVKCPDCGKEIDIFGKSKIDGLCSELGLSLLGRMPIDPTLTALEDAGEFERNTAEYLVHAADVIEKF